MTVNIVAALTVAALAAAFDVRTRRIPNVLNFGAAGAALVYALASHGLAGFGVALGGWTLGVLLFFPIFALRGMGAGDVKLLAALGAWLGPWAVVSIALFASIAGGVLALVVAGLHGYLRKAFTNIWLMLMHWRLSGLRPVPGLTLGDTQSPRLAYAIPITIGVLCTLWTR